MPTNPEGHMVRDACRCAARGRSCAHKSNLNVQLGEGCSAQQDGKVLRWSLTRNISSISAANGISCFCRCDALVHQYLLRVISLGRLVILSRFTPTKNPSNLEQAFQAGQVHRGGGGQWRKLRAFETILCATAAASMRNHAVPQVVGRVHHLTPMW